MLSTTLLVKHFSLCIELFCCYFLIDILIQAKELTNDQRTINSEKSGGQSLLYLRIIKDDYKNQSSNSFLKVTQASMRWDVFLKT